MANFTPAQLLQMAKLMKSKQADNEAQQLERLARTGLSEEQRVQLHSVMRDKAKLAELLSSPQAKELMKIMGGKQGKQGSKSSEI